MIFYSLFLGIIQGLTEFLPISSSGHLLIIQQLINFRLPNELAFDVALHVGTFLALLIYFWPEVIKYLKAFFISLVKGKINANHDARLAWQILIATLPVLIIGAAGGGMIEYAFRSVKYVAIMLIFFGLLFFFYEKHGRKIDTLEKLSWKSALKIGVAQILSLVPGVSRSGVTIIAGLGENLKRDEAARFAFLLSLPAVAAAAAKSGYDLSKIGLSANEAGVFLIGLTAAAVTGYFCLKYFLRYLQHHSLNIFGWYRIILGVIILIWLYYA